MASSAARLRLALVPSAIGPLELAAPHRVEVRAQRLAHERRAVQLQPARGPVGRPQQLLFGTTWIVFTTVESAPQ